MDNIKSRHCSSSSPINIRHRINIVFFRVCHSFLRKENLHYIFCSQQHFRLECSPLPPLSFSIAFSPYKPPTSAFCSFLFSFPFTTLSLRQIHLLSIGTRHFPYTLSNHLRLGPWQQMESFQAFRFATHIASSSLPLILSSILTSILMCVLFASISYTRNDSFFCNFRIQIICPRCLGICRNDWS